MRIRKTRTDVCFPKLKIEKKTVSVLRISKIIEKRENLFLVNL